jgi:divalent metal cation (Fe/Co/Zn/Cd) transporter
VYDDVEPQPHPIVDHESSATVLVGLVLNAALGWWWADPVAALAVVLLVIKEGLEGFQSDDRD